MLAKIKQIRRKWLRYLELRPIHKVIHLLKKHNYLLMDDTLEVFGYNGEYHTLDYVENVSNLEIWEWAADCEEPLKRNFPKADIKITDSFQEIQRTTKLYDTIIIDNHQGPFGDDKCEHFEIIEDCFKKLKNRSALVTNVMPDILISKYQTSNELQEKHISKRKGFYNHSTGTQIDVSFLDAFYRQLALKNGFKVTHLFFVKRNYLVSYLVLCLNKN